MSTISPSDFPPEVGDEFQLDQSKPLVLLLGWVEHEGILSYLKAAGRQYKRKMLESDPENWRSIIEVFNQFNISCVLAKLTPQACRLICMSQYDGVREEILHRLASVPNVVFVYEDMFLGEQADKFRQEYKPYPPKEILDQALRYFGEHSIELVPYKKNAEVTVIAESFLDDTERNLIFRLYVPKGKLWSTEADKFLQLFQDYLSKVDGLAVRLDQKRSDHGVIYEFHGLSAQRAPSISSEFREFSRLLDLCVSDAAAAAKVLSGKNLDAREVTRIIERFAKEARRLQLDIKHEAESKLMSVRHRVEAELMDLAPTDSEWQVIGLMIDAAIPKLALGSPPPSLLLNSAVTQSVSNAPTITYNIRPQIINTVNGIAAGEVKV